MASFHQLRCMRSFMAVVEAGSFNQAANALQIGAASVSEHVTSLERHLRVSLLHRTTRSVQLTDEGRTYLAMCRDVLGRIADAEQQLRPEGRAPLLSGQLTVEMSDGVDAFLLPAVAAFQRVHPDLSIRITRTQHQFDDASRGADVTIRSVPPRDRNVTIARTIGESRTIFLAAPGYLEQHGRPDRPEDLLEHRCIGYLDPLSGRLWKWFFQGCATNVFSLEVPCHLATMQGAVRRQAAVDGQGIINEISHFVIPWLRNGSLVPVLEDWTMPQPICHIACHRDRYRVPRTLAFITHIEQWLRDCTRYGSPEAPGAPIDGNEQIVFDG